MDKTKLGVMGKLESLFDDFLNEKIEAAPFVESFEQLFNSGEVEREKYKALEDILDAAELYEADEAIRKHETYCLDENQLKDVVRKTWETYKSQFNN